MCSLFSKSRVYKYNGTPFNVDTVESNDSKISLKVITLCP